MTVTNLVIGTFTERFKYSYEKNLTAVNYVNVFFFFFFLLTNMRLNFLLSHTYVKIFKKSHYFVTK